MKFDLTPLGFVCVTNDVDTRAPLLYRIFTEGDETTDRYVIYVGKSKDASAPFYRYDANIRNKIKGKPPLNGTGFRPVHEDLHAAYRARQEVTIELVRNVDSAVESPAQARAALQQSCGIGPGRLRRRLANNGRPIGRCAVGRHQVNKKAPEQEAFGVSNSPMRRNDTVKGSYYTSNGRKRTQVIPVVNEIMVNRLIDDFQWRRVEHLVPGKPTDPGQSAADNRLFLEAVLWIAVTESPWRQLPQRLGRWDTVYLRYSRWRKTGVWDGLLEAFRDAPELREPLLRLLEVRTGTTTTHSQVER